MKAINTQFLGFRFLGEDDTIIISFRGKWFYLREEDAWVVRLFGVQMYGIGWRARVNRASWPL